MSDMLGIASSGISAYQRALSTVSNNIANVNTEGYSRQEVDLKDSAPKQMASMYIGTGVMLQTIKRQYDAFAESNLRNSTSDLSAQKPMVEYAKRVMDIMGDKSVGLSSAFDNYFAAASALSADPASTVQRTSFLKSAEGVASRFSELDGQLSLIAKETKEGIQSVATQINTLTGQLALINKSMAKSPTLEGQSPELLDRRDLALRQLSDLVRTKVTFTSNGVVNVSLGTTMTQGLVVNGNNSRPIGIDNSVAGKVELVLDPYGQTEALANASGGQLGGYQTFISQVLEPAQKNLSSLAQIFVKEANSIQKNGIDGYGEDWRIPFAFDPNIATPAAGIQVAITDGMRVATAAQFRVSEASTNITNTRATVKFSGVNPSTALSNSKLVNNPNKTAGVTFKVDGANVYTSVTSLSAGVGATFYIDGAQPGQQLQVLTRDGRQLLGRTLSETEKYQLLNTQNGFAANATFSDAYLNKSGQDAYRGLDVFYGAKAQVLFSQNFDQYGKAGSPIPIAANLESSRIGSIESGIPDGAIKINEESLPAFTSELGTGFTIAGMDLGTIPTSYKFTANVDGQLITKVIPASSTGSLTSLADALNTELNSYGLTAGLSINRSDLQVSDVRGRLITGVALTPADASNGASSGQVSISSSAVQVANWVNGVSKATIVTPGFGTPGQPSFSKFTANLGGVEIDLDNFTSTNMPNLAFELQTRLRALDKSSAISVVMDGANLVLTDKLGRSLKNFALVASDNSDATGGIAKIDNSVLAKTNVRAEAFSSIKVPTSKLDLSKPLLINGQTIPKCDNVSQLVDAINSSDAGVVASVNPVGDLVIEDTQCSPIRIGSLPDGNSLNVSPGTYDPQVRLVQVARDMRVTSAGLDFSKPLQINGVNLSEVGYVIPSLASPAVNTVEFGSPSQSVSGQDAGALVANLNANPDFAKGYKATLVGQRLVISSLSAMQADKDIDTSFLVKSQGLPLFNQDKISSLPGLVDRINSNSEETGVVGSIDLNGDLVLSTTDPKGTKVISIGPGTDSQGGYVANALNLEPKDYGVDYRLSQLLTDDTKYHDIRVSFGDCLKGNPPVASQGDPSDLAKIGFRTGAYIQGGSPDDLLLFVTGKGAANVAVGYEGKPSDVRDSLRSQSLTLKFTASDRYSIVDSKTGTVLADRHYDNTALEPLVEFEGLQIKLSHPPAAGDSYAIDGNFDGLGNNMNMLDMVDLAKKPTENGKTVGNTYVDQINEVGNLAQQADINQQALKVVNDQAVAARDKVSGVNLDDEAAALIRYQQAYQACAKAIQVSGQIFDSIIRIG